MLELLKNFSGSEILVFIILLTFAIKGAVNTLDWFNERGRKFFHKTYQKPKEMQRDIEEIKQSIQKLTENVNMLIQSDKDDIKSFITRQHHYFCYQLKQIDFQSLDCIEKRYSHYKDEGGNSFVHDLMVDLRALPKQNLIKKEG